MAPEVQRFMWLKNLGKSKKNSTLKDSIAVFKNRQDVYDESGYDEKCDMWSIGVIAYTIFCGEQAFKDQTA